jgi:hypothetical protein
VQVELSKQLYTAAESGNISTVKTLLASPGILIDYQNAVGFIASHAVVIWVFISDKFVRYLCAVEQEKTTALIQAAYKGQLEACKLLVQKGANLNIQDKVSLSAPLSMRLPLILSVRYRPNRC